MYNNDSHSRELLSKYFISKTILLVSLSLTAAHVHVQKVPTIDYYEFINALLIAC